MTISRCYYAMFYAVSGLLASIGIARSKHSGVISAFRERFIKTGLIEAEFGDILGVGFDARQESDYELVPLVNRELALKRLHEAQRFVDRVENYLKSTGTQ
ncbi:MAG: HEPN domain-containing protein [Anaerolineae bacterium]